MKLAYEAIDRTGRQVQDTFQAPSVKDGVEELRRKGLMVTNIEASGEEEERRTASSGPAALAKVKLPLSKLVLFTRQMSMLLTSGSALVPSLAAIGRQMTHPKHREMMDIIKTDLEEGATLTDTLGRFPRTFDAAYCAVVAAGESSAQLPKMFDRLAITIGKRKAMRNRVVGALVYPVLLTMLSIGIMGVMMFFVVPRFAGMFETLGVDLPSSTQLMMTMAGTARGSWFVMLPVFAGAIVGMVLLVRTEQGNQFLSNIQIRIPVVGRLMSRLIQAQTFRVLGLLLDARVGLLESLDLARRVTRNDRFQRLYDDLEESITRGESVSGTLERADLVNPSIVQAVQTGEESGRLGASISYVADVLDEENAEMLTAVTKLIEPLILIVMGVVVGGVAISLFMPLFDMTAAV